MKPWWYGQQFGRALRIPYHLTIILDYIEDTKMKPFNLEAAKAGKPVCTRAGMDVRIIRFDRKGNDKPIVGLINISSRLIIECYTIYGMRGQYCSSADLMMKTVKHERFGVMTQNGTLKRNVYSSVSYADSVAMGCGGKAVTITWEE